MDSDGVANGFDTLVSGDFRSPLRYEFWPALAASRKVLVVLHGRGDTLEGFHWLPQALGLDAFNVLFVEAPDPYGPGFSWYELPPKQGPGIVRSRAWLFDLLDRLQSEFGLVSRDLFLFGFSQGCLVSLDVGLRYPKLLGGIVGVSGYVFFESEYPQAFSKVATQQRFWVSHGYEDEMLSFETTQASIELLRSQGIRIDWSPLHKGHTVDPAEEIPLIRAFFERQLTAN